MTSNCIWFNDNSLSKTEKEDSSDEDEKSNQRCNANNEKSYNENINNEKKKLNDSGASDHEGFQDIEQGFNLCYCCKLFQDFLARLCE